MCCLSMKSTVLSPVVEEILYPALEDYQLDIMIGEGPAARSVKIDLPPFTLVGATTRAGMLTNPFARPFRYRIPIRVLSKQRFGDYCCPFCPVVAVGYGRRGRDGSGQAQPRYAAYCQPPFCDVYAIMPM